MKQFIKKVWGKIRIGVIVILSLGIGALGMYDYQQYTEIRHEADQVWEQHIERIDGKEVSVEAQSHPLSASEIEQETVAAVKQVPANAGNVNPVEETEARVKTASRPLGVESILPKIQRLESSGGINDSCKQYGKVNGYGFGIYKNHFRCYETKEQVEKEVAAWFQDNLKTYTLTQSLCRYNTGSPTDDCVYAQKFASL
jgi:hypothetical protein